MRRAFITAAAGAALALVATAAGWWFLIREDVQLATSPQEIPQELLEASAAPSLDADTAGSSSFEDALVFQINSNL